MPLRRPRSETNSTSKVFTGASVRIIARMNGRKRFAIDHLERVASLMLSGSRARPSRALMKMQSAITPFLLARLVA